jgi:stalled ribosome rescue protein Dom34
VSAQEPTVGVVGLKYGRAHIAAFQASGCRVVAVCQRDQAGAKAVADQYGVPRVFDSWERMIDEARPEIVVIATPARRPHRRWWTGFAQSVLDAALESARRVGRRERVITGHQIR